MSLADCFRMDLNLVHACNETPAIVSGRLERPKQSIARAQDHLDLPSHAA